SHVDVAATAGVAAGHGEDVGAGAERFAGFFGDVDLHIAGGALVDLGGEDAIEVDVGVVVGVDLELEVGEGRVGQGDRAAEPDFAGVPGCAVDAAGGAAVAEAAGAGLPGEVVEVGHEPVIGRFGEGVTPVLFLVPGGGDDGDDRGGQHGGDGLDDGV